MAINFQQILQDKRSLILKRISLIMSDLNNFEQG